MALLFAKNNSLSAVTALPASISGGGLNLISTQTASSSATISFTSGIDSTYKEYIFKFIDIHGSGDGVDLTFQASTNTGSSYGVTVTTTDFIAYHNESGSDNNLIYNSNHDLAQSTSFMQLSQDIGAGESDQCAVGILHLFNPSSTTFVKHYISRFNNYHDSNYSMGNFGAGYFNTTSAIDAVQFKMSTGNIDAGTIKLYGVS
tara:strand:+ start:1014 stop:1622 length:609 start_codon:yes stop_codon:yes gene_type:complete